MKKNKDKSCNGMAPVFRQKEYHEFPGTQVRKMTAEEIERYMDERQAAGTYMPGLAHKNKMQTGGSHNDERSATDDWQYGRQIQHCPD